MSNSASARQLNPPFGPDPLARFQFDAPAYAALARQGFVATEHRGQGTYYKLRFRCGGRQIVRYLHGADEAAAVRAALQTLQQGRRRERTLRQIASAGRQLLRDAKRQLEPLVAARGWKFHGRCVRRPRITLTLE